MPKRSKEDTQKTIGSIKNTVIAMTKENGFSSVTYTTLSEASGISRTGISHHFPTTKTLYDIVSLEASIALDTSLENTGTTDDVPANFLHLLTHGSIVYKHNVLFDLIKTSCPDNHEAIYTKALQKVVTHAS